jgi:hypothetical protein
MSEAETSTKSKVPAVKLFVLAAIILLSFFFWQDVLGNAIFIATLFFAAVCWTKCRSTGWMVLAAVMLFIVIAFGLNAGELWYQRHQTLAWFFGAETTLQTYNGFKPVFFTAIVISLFMMLYYWILEPMFRNWGNVQKITSGVVMATVFYTMFFIGGYLNKSQDSHIGTLTVGWATSSGATVLDWGGKSLRELANDQKANIKLDQQNKPEGTKQ